MTINEKVWLERCKMYPERFRIDVDNDCVFVTEIESNECVFEFDSYGWEMVLKLLRYIGCNAEEV